MALIKRPECGKDFSDKAAACPNCGCPINEVLKGLSTVSRFSVGKQSLDYF